MLTQPTAQGLTRDTPGKTLQDAAIPDPDGTCLS